MRILVIEDEIELCESLAEGLSLENYAVDKCYNGIDGVNLICFNHYDLVLLDLNLPYLDGFEVIKKVKEFDKNTKILIISARDKIEDKITGLDLGAVDYLTKPFNFEELKARIRNLINRKFIQEQSNLTLKNLEIDTKNHIAKVDKTNINLTKKEFSILEYLALNIGRTISQEELFSHVWDYDDEVFSNCVRVHIATLRKKLIKNLGYDPIKNKVKAGYYLDFEENE